MTLKLEPLPPKEAIDYLASKGLHVSFAWQDVYAEEHALNFTVAKMARLDLLATVQEHVTRAIQEGRTLTQFAADLRPILEREGWWGKQEMTDPLTGETKVVQLGSPRRLQIIYDTNLRTAYSAGRWERFQRAKDVLPYLTYRTMRDGRVRPLHKSWDGVTLPQDHVWWDTHYPPNGWRCRCIAYGIDKEDAEKLQQAYESAQIKAAESQANADRVNARSNATRAEKKAADDAARDAAWRASWISPVKYDAPPTLYKEWVNPRTGEIRRVPVGIDPGFDYNPGKGRMAQLEQLLREKEAAFDRPAFIKASRTVLEAEQVAVSLGVKSADFTQDLAVANHINEGLALLAGKGLPVPHHVRIDENRFVQWEAQLGEALQDMPAAFTVDRKTGETYLFLRPSESYWAHPQMIADHLHQIGYWSTSDLHHAMLHESGHAGHYINDAAAYLGLSGTKLTPEQAIIAAKVSSYAAESPREFVAEAFAALAAGIQLDDDVLALYRSLGGKLP